MIGGFFFLIFLGIDVFFLLFVSKVKISINITLCNADVFEYLIPEINPIFLGRLVSNYYKKIHPFKCVWYERFVLIRSENRRTILYLNDLLV